MILYILDMYANYHFPDINLLIKELNRALNKGGKIFIIDPTYKERSIVDKFMQMKEDGHIRFYSLDEFVDLFKKVNINYYSDFKTSITFPRKEA